MDIVLTSDWTDLERIAVAVDLNRVILKYPKYPDVVIKCSEAIEFVLNMDKEFLELNREKITKLLDEYMDEE